MKSQENCIKTNEFNNNLHGNSIFTENKGQISDQNKVARADVLFSGRTNDMVLFLKSNGISYQQYQIKSWNEVELVKAEPVSKKKIPDKIDVYRIDINWLGSNPHCDIQKGEKIQSVSNYYLSNYSHEVTGVKSFKRITYKNIYQGIKMIWYYKNGVPEYDFLLEPGVDHKQIKMEIIGATDIKINSNGSLSISTPYGIITESKPVVFQNNELLEASWNLNGNIVGFDIIKYDHKYPLNIDPTIVAQKWGTYYGAGGLWDTGLGITTGENSVYMSGSTGVFFDIATSGSHQATFAGGSYDAFLVKFNSEGVRQWATYYGGSGADLGYDCILDNSGNSYLIGTTSSSDTNSPIATYNSHQSALLGSKDAFIAKFNNNGVRIWGTYVGGSQADEGISCDIDRFENIYMCGYTESSDSIATSGTHSKTYKLNVDAFLVKFDSSGNRIWGTYFGDSLQDQAYDCKVDSSLNVYLVGHTMSGKNISTFGCHQPLIASSLDAFVAKFNSNGRRIWSTYYGGG